MKCRSELSDQDHRPGVAVVWILGLSAAFLVEVVPEPASGDSWESPRTFEVRSENGQYLARARPRAKPLAPSVTVLQIVSDEEETLWRSELDNSVSPVNAFVSDDGVYVVTLDNWHRFGYGDNVMAIYDRDGLIKKFSLEELVGEAVQRLGNVSFHELFSHSVSSRWWRRHCLLLFDGEGEHTTFGIWLDWAAQWFVWQLSDGARVELAAPVLDQWNDKGRRWAHRQLRLPELIRPEELRGKWTLETMEWSNRKSARYLNKITACRYLGHRRDSEDCAPLEKALLTTERNAMKRMELRINADRALAIHDGVASNFQDLQQHLLGNADQFHRLGNIDATIQLPNWAASQGHIYVWFFPESLGTKEWRSAEPEHLASKRLKSPPANNEDGTVEVNVRAVRPGKYWVKAIWDWDWMRPSEGNSFAYEGMRDSHGMAWTTSVADVESKGSVVFEVKAGETAQVTVDCNQPRARDDSSSADY